MKQKIMARMRLGVATCLALWTTALSAQSTSYTYQWEGFEDAAWVTASTNVTVSTGKWTTNKNVQSTEYAYDGTHSLKISAKAGIVSPELKEGAGALVYYAYVQNRQVNVEVSVDGTNWTNVEGYKETSDWTKHIVTINNPNVKYVKISTTSNNLTYLDNLVITKTDGTLADGTALVPPVDVPYFKQDFEAANACPGSKETASTETAITIDGQGEWRYSNSYKGTNESYIVDGSARDLRMSKGGSYVITPIVGQGVAKLSFMEGRKGRTITVYSSKDGGNTWTQLKAVTTENQNTVQIYDHNINRLKLVNGDSGDADVDNIIVTGFPEGTLPTVNTGDVKDVGSSKATVIGSLTSKGDKRMIEWGVCWGKKDTECSIQNAECVKAETDEYSLPLKGLPSETTIYYRAYAMSMAGVAYGEVKNFTTLAPTAAVVVIDSLVNDASVGDEKHIFVRMSATIEDNGGANPTTVGVCYNIKGNPTIDDEVSTTYLYGNKFSKSVPLQPKTTYYLRAYATNLAGTGYSEVMTFTTPELIVPEYAHHVYYVSTKGDDSTGDGSEGKPFYNVQNAIDKVVAGDSIFVMAGTYNYSARINISTVGQCNSGMIAMYAKGGRAIFDFKAIGLGDNNQGVRLTGSYWHIYGLDICNAGDNGMLIERDKPAGGDYNSIKDKTDEGHDNFIENCKFYRNQDTGLQLKNLAENNKIVNCDSYFNADPTHENADGFAVKISHGTGNYFYGCRAWNNCDDGWDGFVKTDGGFPDNRTTTYENCWAFKNGYIEQGGSTSNGDGNGFKLGSAYGIHNFILNRCLAVENYQKGFDQNHNPGTMIFNNCAGYAKPLLANKSHFTYRIDESVSNGHEVIFTNCVAISDGISDRTKSAYAPYSISGNKVTFVTCDFNTLPTDYQSVDPTGMDGERDASGNLPVLPFMRIAEGNSKLIDKGTEVVPYAGESSAAMGILFNGKAPDLGCFETKEQTETGISALTVDRDVDNNLRIQVMRTATGLLLVTIPGEESNAVRTICAMDVSGRVITSHTFYGNTTVVNLGSYKGMTILVVKSDGIKGSAKILM